MPEMVARNRAKMREYHRKNADRRIPQMRAWKARSPLHVKLANDKRTRMGLTIEEFRELCARQDWRCAICGDRAPGKKGLAIDHCHKTGVIRGALCDRCNLGLGLFRDTPEFLRAAAEYVEVYREGPAAQAATLF